MACAAAGPGACGAGPRGRGDPVRGPPADRGGRRGDLLRRPPPSCARSPRRQASRSARPRPGRGRCPRSPARAGRDRQHRHRGRQPMASAADVVIGIGTRYSDFTTASRTLFGRPQVRFVNINVAAADAVKLAGGPGRRRPRGAARAGRRAGWLVHSAPPTGRGAELAAAWDEVVGRRLRPRAPAARPVGGHRRGQRRGRAARRGGVRGRLDAGRPAQAVAHPGPEGLSRRVRLLLHGLRDRRRPRREAGRAGPGGLRAGRRRVLPDDGPGTGHRRAGGHQADRRPGAEPRLRVDRRAVRDRGRASGSVPATGTATRPPAGWMATSCRWTSPRTRRSLGVRVLRAQTIAELRAALARPGRRPARS